VLWSAHIDWITTTWRAGTLVMDQSFANAQAQWVWNAMGVTSAVLPLERWAWQGYIGWSCGDIAFGERPDGCVVRASGATAGRYWTDGRPTGHNVSRIDVCVDVWWNEPPDSIIARHNVETIDARQQAHSRPWRVACVNGYGDGDTLYLGARSSDTYVRIYNKEKESDNEERWQGCTRYEVEFKNAEAVAYVGRMGSRRNDTGRTAQEVHSVLYRRGICVLADLLADGAVSAPIGRVVTSDDRKLDWLRTQVAPTIKHLTVTMGRDIVLSALGLDISKRS
jgi:hypothetical protein